jgi:hypothetical protein
MEKILNLLFDTFHSTKYFSCSFIHHSLLFLCKLFYLSKCNENFMVDYLLCEEATVVFLDFCIHKNYMLLL